MFSFFFLLRWDILVFGEGREMNMLGREAERLEYLRESDADGMWNVQTQRRTVRNELEICVMVKVMEVDVWTSELDQV